MSIKVRFFASLRERLGVGETMIDISTPLTASELWSKAAGGNPMPPNTLIAVNLEYAQRTHIVSDGDEVAFFPPVTGG